MQCEKRELDIERPVNCPGVNDATVFLHHRTEGGFVNQLMGHMSAFLLARQLRASVIVPSVQHRATFDAKDMVWTHSWPSTLFDMPRMRYEWRALGVGVYDVAPESLRSRHGVEGVPSQFVDRVEHRIALDPKLVTRRSPTRRKPFDSVARELCDAIAAEVKARVTRRAGNVTAADAAAAAATPAAAPGQDPTLDPAAPIVLSVGALLLAFPLRDRAAWTRELVRTLPFAPKLVELADLAVARAELRGLTPFDGVHLRLERDARGWLKHHTEEWVRQHYEQAMQTVGFDSDTPTFVASGLLSYDSGDSWDLAVRDVLEPHSTSVLHKGMLLHESEVAGLLSEQIAALDFLILLRARKYVGIAVSSFSVMLSEFRTTIGYSPDDSLLVTIPPFKTELFSEYISFADAIRLEPTRYDTPPAPPGPSRD